ncbi:MAG: hypothetical protein OEZ43_05795 [Gammaproteobacteria bacterium]|nr:hypothetical protein [Gammaproteobacteria bacterium]
MLVQLFVTLMLVLEQRELGIQTTFIDGALAITSVDRSLENKIRQGDTIRAIGGNGFTLDMGMQNAVDIPDQLATFALYNRFFSDQEQLYEIVAGNEIILYLSSGETVELQPRIRELSDVPLRFWLTNAFGIFAFMIGIGVWAYGTRRIESHLFLASGLGFLLITSCTSVYVSRDIAMDAQIFLMLSSIGHFGGLLFRYAIVTLLWFYPQRIGRFPLGILMLLVPTLIWANELGQWFDWPIHTFHIHSNIPLFIFVLSFAWVQWRRSARKPIERAATSWFVLAVAISTGLGLILYFVPLILNGAPILTPWNTLGVVLLLYLGVGAGVSRFGLFELDKWWVLTWLWLISGVLVFVLDILLAYVVNASESISLALSVLLAGWLYFPLRQLLYQRYLKRSHDDNSHVTRDVIALSLGKYSDSEFRAKWRKVLKDLYQPLEARLVDMKAQSKSELGENGLNMLVPVPGAPGVIVLCCADRGRRLFGKEDLQFVEQLLSLSREIISIQDAKNQATEKERERIMRDLHDDVASSLLTLSHQAPTPALQNSALQALDSLKQVVYSLDNSLVESLEDYFERYVQQMEQRVNAAGVNFRHDIASEIPAITLNSHYKINLSRICSEAVSNALKHSSATLITFKLSYTDPWLYLHFYNNGVDSPPETWQTGRGCHHIRLRAQELGGDAVWRMNSVEENGSSGDGCVLEVKVLLDME